MGAVVVCQNAGAAGNRMLPRDDRQDVRTSLSSPSLSPLSDIPDGGVLAVAAILDGRPERLILCRVGERVSAFRNVCPHAGRPLDWAPGSFLLDGGDLICAAHGARFDRLSGLCRAGPCRGASLTPVPVAVVDGEVWLGGE